MSVMGRWPFYRDVQYTKFDYIYRLFVCVCVFGGGGGRNIHVEYCLKCSYFITM